MLALTYLDTRATLMSKNGVPFQTFRILQIFSILAYRSITIQFYFESNSAGSMLNSFNFGPLPVHSLPMQGRIIHIQAGTTLFLSFIFPNILFLRDECTIFFTS
jgi:hypothetical protein